MAEKDSRETILITGITGGLARQVVVRLRRRFRIIGVDNRRPKRKLVGVEHFYRIRYTQSSFENIFRSHPIKKVLHLGRLLQGELQDHGVTTYGQMHQNTVGTEKLLALADKYDLNQAIILSTYHVYGALPDNPIFMNEDWNLRASLNFPDLRDVVEMDYAAHIWKWKHRNKIKTAILRPTNIVGPLMKNTFTRYLKGPLSPTIMGFNPMIQTIHEKDMSSIIVGVLEAGLHGTYNVAPKEVISLKEALEIAGSKAVPLPLPVLFGVTQQLGSLWQSIPKHLLEFLQYPCIIDGSKLLKKLDHFKFRYTIREALDSLR
jgi:UDP-glucose 4-epimerase